MKHAPNQVALIEADAVVATMNRARMALAEAKTIQQTKLVLDTAAAAEIFARRQKLGEEASDLALSIKVEALRKLGEMLSASPRASGVQKAGTVLGGSKVELPRNDAPTLADLGLTKKESAVAQKLAAMPDDEFHQVRDGHITVAKAIAAVDAVKATPSAPAPAPSPASNADEAHEGTDVFEDLLRENKTLQAQVDSLSKGDANAELSRYVRMYEDAQRKQSELMDKVMRRDRELQKQADTLKRICKAVGEEDPRKVALAVESMAKKLKVAA